MKLLIFNGSPKGDKGNSGLMSTLIKEGVDNEAEVDICNLNNIKKHSDYITKIINADRILIIFPLYADAMPGIVKKFIETLDTVKEELSGKSIGFVVHSGFPEAIQSRAIEKYLIWLADYFKLNYMGTLIFAGSVPFSKLPKFASKKQRNSFLKLGEEFSTLSIFTNDTINSLIEVEKYEGEELNKVKRIFDKGIGDIMWNFMLIKNGAFKKRYNKPYEG